jgi:prepilin-type N-terminal cleavage/methylation domain-containing protein
MQAMKLNRGFTLNELLVAIVILLLFFAIAYAALLPVITYLSPAQAKINTQQNAVPLLYKLQRDIRQSDYRAVYVYQSGSANPLPTTLTDIQTFAVATAKTGTSGGACFPGGDFKTVPGFGQPYWQGFEVFTLQNAALYCVYEQLAGGQQTAFPDNGEAKTAITSALAATNKAIFGNAVLDVKMNQDTTPYVVDFLIKAVSTVNGRSNATTYTEDMLTRN